MNVKRPVVRRYAKNPILTKDDVPYPVSTVHNAGAVKCDDRYLLLFRSHQLNGRSVLGLAESSDGFSFQVKPKPFLVPADRGAFATYEEYGVEDPGDPTWVLTDISWSTAPDVWEAARAELADIIEGASACPDLDGDDDVDIADIMLVASRWHTAVGDPGYHPAYDLDSNGVIDIVDIMLVAVHWGETCDEQ